MSRGRDDDAYQEGRPRRSRDDDWDDDDRPRRRREDEDYDDRPLRRGPRSGAVTGVAVYGIVLGSLVTLVGICGLIGILAAGGEAGARGGFAIPGLGGAFAIAVLFVLLILIWGIGAIISGVGLINRQNWARIFTLVLGGLGAVVGLLFLIGAFGSLAGPDVPGAGGAKALSFLIGLLLAALFIGHCIYAFVVLLSSRVGAEFE